MPIGRLLSDASQELLATAGGRAAGDGADLDVAHLLWAATQVGSGRHLLEQAGADPDALAAQVEQSLPAGGGVEEPRLTPSAKRALLRAHAASQEAGASYIGPEHILAAVVEDPSSGADGALSSEGAGARDGRGGLGGAGAGSGGGSSAKPTLDEYGGGEASRGPDAAKRWHVHRGDAVLVQRGQDGCSARTAVRDHAVSPGASTWSVRWRG